jgi:hypothetical protein
MTFFLPEPSVKPLSRQIQFLGEQPFFAPFPGSILLPFRSSNWMDGITFWEAQAV